MIKKILIAMILLVASSTSCDNTAIIFSMLSYRMSKLEHENIVDPKRCFSTYNLNSMHYGAGQWHCIAFLTISDPSQQCPYPWRDYYNCTTGVRACGRQDSNSGSRQGLLYIIGQQYNGGVWKG